MRYPPYDDKKFYWSKQMGIRRSMPTLWCIYWLPLLVVGFFMGYFFQVDCTVAGGVVVEKPVCFTVLEISLKTFITT